VFGFHFCGGARVARSLVFSRSAAVFPIFFPGARVRATAGLVLGLLRFWSGSILHALQVCTASRRFPLLALKFCAVFFHARSGPAAAAARDPFFRVIFPLVFSSCVGLSWCNQFKRQHQIKSRPDLVSVASPSLDSLLYSICVARIFASRPRSRLPQPSSGLGARDLDMFIRR
jgi:hypothetical protein